MARNKWLRDQKPFIIGHRGAFSEAPENTMLSFEKAVELGADMIEFDVRMCKSGEIVVIHDAEVDRTSDGSGLVREMTLEELKQLDFGEGEKIPTLEEVLKFAKNKIALNIELKEPDIVDKVVALVESYDMVDDVIISSFYHNALVKVKELNPAITTAPLFMHRPVSVANLANITNSEGLHPWFEYVDKKFVEEAHKRNLFVNPWTVDDEETMRKMIEVGVDGIITNDIETLAEIISQIT
ncbi:MAG: glycerophosphodiester phosphodiesterase [Candidatus Njordarchaeia archaeon]